MKKLLTLTAILEGTTGLALLVSPALVVSLLLNSSLIELSGVLLGRLAGAALISIAVMCWMYRNEDRAGGIVNALLFYNGVAAALLVYAGSSGFVGFALWLVALLHGGMAVWCIRLWQKKQQ